MSSSEEVGFVGVGHMGGPMARRLLDAGRAVVVFDPDERAVVALTELGARRAASVREVADTARTVCLSLPYPETVRQVVLGEEGLATGSAVRSVVDFSTVGPRVAATVASGLAPREIVYVDAPVSGGVGGARAGTLAIMVSCPRALFDALRPLFAVLGNPFLIGESPGQAQTLKLANNLLAAAAIAVSSEAMAMGARAGIDPALMLEVINAGSGRNSATQDKFPRAILPGTFDYGFATGLAYKDVRLCIDEAEALGVPMVIGAAVREMLAITQAMYGAESDYTSICRVVESWAGTEVRSRRAT
jgi:3-hydroxyisobutyrate dehydrogenase